MCLKLTGYIWVSDSIFIIFDERMYFMSWLINSKEVSSRYSKQPDITRKYNEYTSFYWHLVAGTFIWIQIFVNCNENMTRNKVEKIILNIRNISFVIHIFIFDFPITNIERINENIYWFVMFFSTSCHCHKLHYTFDLILF